MQSTLYFGLYPLTFHYAIHGVGVLEWSCDIYIDKDRGQQPHKYNMIKSTKVLSVS